MNDIKENIITICTRKITAEGFKKTSMDDLAAECKISKKTFYKYFANKDELVETCVLHFIKVGTEKAREIFDTQGYEISTLIHFSKIMGEYTSQFSDAYLMDIQTYRPDLWLKVEELREKTIFMNISTLISKGQERGDVIDGPPELLGKIVANFIRSIMNPTFILESRTTPDKLIQLIMRITVHGIITEKGRNKLLETLLPGVSK